jgi:hypothetical protein
VEINLAFIADRKLSGDIRRELKLKDKFIKRIRQDTEVKVGEIIRG